MSNNTLNGIDIFDGDVQWNSTNLSAGVKANNLYFNFIKATEGISTLETNFVSNWQMSINAGLICGAYHYFRPQDDPTDQANFFISTFKKVSGAGALPLAIDIEENTDSTLEAWQALTNASGINNVITFLNIVQKAIGTPPVIYTSNSFWTDVVDPLKISDETNSYFSKCILWVVDETGTHPTPTPWKNNTPPFTFRQYHLGEDGSPSNGPYDITDQDYYNGSLKNLLNLTTPGYTITENPNYSNIVRDLQQELINKNLLNDVADGFFGAKTNAAVKAFQQSVGIAPNGIVDTLTWNNLLP